jgi:hypothetical protein
MGIFLSPSPGRLIVWRLVLDQATAFLEFEYIFAIALAAVIVLVLLFYVIYPYDKYLKKQ